MARQAFPAVAIRVTDSNENLGGGLLLLIDSRGQISAATETMAPVPFTYARADLGFERIRRALEGANHDPLSLRAVREAMRQATGDVPVQAPFPASLIRAMGRAVATGLIKVAIELPCKLIVSFEVQRPRGSATFDAAVFPSRQIAINYLADLLADGGNVSAFNAALAYPDEAPYTGLGTEGLDQASRIASLLVTRRLILKPIEFFQWRYRLMWIEDYGSLPVATAPAIEPAPRASPRWPTTAPRAAVASTLPDPPEVTTPQAQALIAAAQDGTPFCEECARAAMESAGA